MLRVDLESFILERTVEKFYTVLSLCHFYLVNEYEGYDQLVAENKREVSLIMLRFLNDKIEYLLEERLIVERIIDDLWVFYRNSMCFV